MPRNKYGAVKTRIGTSRTLTARGESPRKTLTLILPLAPTTNNLFVNVRGRGRVKSKGYNAWFLAAKIAAIAQNPSRIAGDCRVEIAVPWNMRGDIDNRIKAALDFLVAIDLIDDDKNIHGLRIDKNLITHAAEMIVTVIGDPYPVEIKA